MDLPNEGAYDVPTMSSPQLTGPSSAMQRTERGASAEARALARYALAGAWLFSCATAPPAPAAPSASESPPAAEPSASTASPSAPASPVSSTPSEPREAARDARGKDEIQAVIAANRDKMRACYDAALKNNPGIQGDLVVTFVINPDGSVKSAEVNWTESELHVPELDSCAVDVLRSLKFPPSSRRLESKVNYPFNFNPRQP